MWRETGFSGIEKPLTSIFLDQISLDPYKTLIL